MMPLNLMLPSTVILPEKLTKKKMEQSNLIKKHSKNKKYKGSIEKKIFGSSKKQIKPNMLQPQFIQLADLKQ